MLESLSRQKLKSIWYNYFDESEDTYELYKRLKEWTNKKEFIEFMIAIKQNTESLLKNIKTTKKEWHHHLSCCSWTSPELIPTIINFWELLTEEERRKSKINKLYKNNKEFLLDAINRFHSEIDEIPNRKHLFHRTYLKLMEIWVPEKEIWYSTEYLIKITEEINKDIDNSPDWVPHKFKKVIL